MEDFAESNFCPPKPQLNLALLGITTERVTVRVVDVQFAKKSSHVAACEPYTTPVQYAALRWSPLPGKGKGYRVLVPADHDSDALDSVLKDLLKVARQHHRCLVKLRRAVDRVLGSEQLAFLDTVPASPAKEMPKKVTQPTKQALPASAWKSRQAGSPRPARAAPTFKCSGCKRDLPEDAFDRVPPKPVIVPRNARDERMMTIVELRKSGMSATAIGAKLGIGRTTVTYILNKAVEKGLINADVLAVSPPTPKQREAARLHDEEGLDFAAMAHKLGISAARAEERYEAGKARTR